MTGKSRNGVALMRISNIDFLGAYSVKLAFSDGFVAAIDLEPALRADDPLRDPCLFVQGKTNGLTIEWPGGIDFCPDVLRIWGEAGRVLSPRDTESRLAMVSGDSVAA